MPLGDLRTDRPLYTEQWLSQSWSVGLAQGQSWAPSAGAITMPHTGDVHVDLYVAASYGSGILAMSVWPAMAVGPTQAWAGKVTEFSDNGGWIVCPFFARWAGLAVGTYLDLTIEIRNTINNGGCTIQGLNGTIRTQAT